MIQKILDIHIHSKYSRACSKDLELPKIAAACLIKGIDIVATGDFTHPAWFEHIKESLVEVNNSGLYQLSSRANARDLFQYCDSRENGNVSNRVMDSRLPAGRHSLRGNDNIDDNSKLKITDIKFILSAEISCIYKHKDKTRRLHLVILAPNIEAVEKFNAELDKRKINRHSDGRPIMGLSAKEILRILLEIDERFLLIPAHAWTPWFSIFGSKSGYDSIEECFEELAPHIKAIETGLSSDPPMNRRWSKLDNIILVSNSDAHSLNNLGREANVFAFENENDINFKEIARIIKTGDRKNFLYTIEFYPEEGKYHYDGHADCKICFAPAETKKHHNICPKCKKELTVGVLNRADKLADRNENDIPKNKFIPHKYIVPLREIISGVFEVGVASKRVKKEYDAMIKNIGNEFYILLQATDEEILKNISDKNIFSAIKNTRSGRVKINPGYDGVFGKVDTLPKKIKQSGQRALL
ncbi:MAG: endonuclease Q family protein [Patescibacteria group bacterium]